MNKSNYKSSNIQARAEDSYSVEIQDIIDRIPGWTLRWGITTAMIILLLILLASWFIHFHDTITARIVLTTSPPPAPIIARSDGRIQLMIENQVEVEYNQVLGLISNPAEYEDINTLEKVIKDYRAGSLTIIQTEQCLLREFKLGMVQDAFLSWFQSLQNNILSRDLHQYDKQIAGILEEMQYYHTLNHQLNEKKNLLEQEAEIIEKKYLRNETLFKEGTIALATFEVFQADLINSKRTFQEVKSEITRNLITISQLSFKLRDLRILQDKEKLMQQKQIEVTLRQLENDIIQWKQLYVFTSPIEGIVSLNDYWSNSQFASKGEEILTIVPLSKTLYGRVQVSLKGSGKIAIGQTAFIYLDNYPSNEYGAVTGKVSSISVVPKNDLYTITVDLPDGLMTGYHKTLPMKQEMQGSVKIITQDLRLLERIFFQFREIYESR